MKRERERETEWLHPCVDAGMRCAVFNGLFRYAFVPACMCMRVCGCLAVFLCACVYALFVCVCVFCVDGLPVYVYCVYLSVCSRLFWCNSYMPVCFGCLYFRSRNDCEYKQRSKIQVVWVHIASIPVLREVNNVNTNGSSLTAERLNAVWK